MEGVHGAEAVGSTVRTDAADTPPIRGGLVTLALGFIDPVEIVARGIRTFRLLLREGTYQVCVSRTGTIWLEPEEEDTGFEDEVIAQVVIEEGLRASQVRSFLLSRTHTEG